MSPAVRCACISLSFLRLGMPLTPFIGEGILHAATMSQSMPVKYWCSLISCAPLGPLPRRSFQFCNRRRKGVGAGAATSRRQHCEVVLHPLRPSTVVVVCEPGQGERCRVVEEGHGGDEGCVCGGAPRSRSGILRSGNFRRGKSAETTSTVKQLGTTSIYAPTGAS
eukprot:5211201-Pleurochrysis_carterae.AAC.1